MTEVIEEIRQFSTQNASNFDLSSYERSVKERLVGLCAHQLETSTDPVSLTPCLNCIRILTRDKVNIDLLAQEATIALLLQHTKLADYAAQSGECVAIVDCNTEVVSEGLKCLCNLMYNCPSAVGLACSQSCMKGIVNRIKTLDDPDMSYDVKFYDMRLLFLVTALAPETRPRLLIDFNGLEVLNDAMNSVLKSMSSEVLNDRDNDYLCEILKVLFNLAYGCRSDSEKEALRSDFHNLVKTLKKLILIQCETADKKDELVSQSVNLLTSVPAALLQELIEVEEGEDLAPDDLYKSEKHMRVVEALLQFAGKQTQQVHSSLKVSLSPILQVLCTASRANREIRKYCRLKVLPHLRDEVYHLPEEGDTLRNKLCRLLTNPVQDVTEMVAFFVFVLCKERVNRAIKYTGYGNFAGYLCRHGLMSGGRGESAGDYSSSSEDSETEEYADLKERINPVTGRWEPERPDPLAGMSEEQKEYEAMKLVQEIDRLQRSGMIQPGVIGDDGQVRPAEHVLELAESVAAQQEKIRRSGGHDSDSDDD